MGPCATPRSLFFARQLPEFVFLAAAKVGGILANSTRPAEFLYENLAIQTNVIHAAWQNGAQKLVFLGSSCIYPQLAPQPIKEEYLLTGPLEPTNEAYAIAKIAGLKLAAAYRKQYGFRAVSLMPTNLYGPGDNFDLETSHVLPALIRRFHEAKMARSPSVTLWGTGTIAKGISGSVLNWILALCVFCVAIWASFAPSFYINSLQGEAPRAKVLVALSTDALGVMPVNMHDKEIKIQKPLTSPQFSYKFPGKMPLAKRRPNVARGFWGTARER
jgi:nucleoside-diphosphate-sugar epimerase